MKKKQYWFLPVAMALSFYGGTSLAAQMDNLNGQTCGTNSDTWHFVNNQTGGAAAGTLTAGWSSGNTCVVGASKVLGNTQHFYCTATGTLASASTNLPGRLVLSDYTCEDIKEPPCDPKKDPDCKK
jgi:hypothetical protein